MSVFDSLLGPSPSMLNVAGVHGIVGHEQDIPRPQNRTMPQTPLVPKPPQPTPSALPPTPKPSGMFSDLTQHPSMPNMPPVPTGTMPPIPALTTGLFADLIQP